ncbi:MAG: hypothetical protein ABIU05_09400 [Nitrospirales bacterium]
MGKTEYARLTGKGWRVIKVALKFVEGVNSKKIRVIQRRSYCLRDEGVPAPQSPHLHARPDTKSGGNNTLGNEKTLKS